MADFPNLPEYLQDETQEVVHTRMLNAVPEDIDGSEGSFIYDATAPAAVEISDAKNQVVDILNRSFLMFTYGPYLINLASAEGIDQRPAVAATGELTITGPPNHVYNLVGKRVAVPATTDQDSEAILFRFVDDSVTADASGVAVTPIVAVVPGSSGNVPPGAISFMVDIIDGAVTINNLTETKGGFDIESETSIQERTLFKKRNPSSSGNIADYMRWASEVPGVARVSVLPATSTSQADKSIVRVYIVDDSLSGAPETLIEDVQDHIYPITRMKEEVSYPSPYTNPVGGIGMTDDTFASGGRALSLYMGDPYVQSEAVRNLWSKDGDNNVLRKPGLWKIVAAHKYPGSLSPTPTFPAEFGVRDRESKVWLKETSSPSAYNAVMPVNYLFPSDQYEETELTFWWDGVTQPELVIKGPATASLGQSGEVRFDTVYLQSLFSQGGGVSPETAFVIVDKPTRVEITVKVNIEVVEGANAQTVRDNVLASIQSYFDQRVFQEDADIKYSRVSQAISDVAGVYDYSDLKLNYNGSDVQNNIRITQSQVGYLAGVEFL